MLIFLVTANYYTTRTRLYSSLVVQSQALLDGLNYSIEGFLANKDMSSIQRVLSNFGTSSDVKSIYLVNRDHIILASSDPRKLGKLFNTDLVIKVLETEKTVMAYLQNGEKVLVLVRPVRGEEYSASLRTDVMGVVYLAMDTAHIDGQIENTLLSNLLIIALFSAFIFIYVIVISRKLLINPIKVIEKYTSLIAQGHFYVRIPGSSQDEIGQLTAHLNTMAGNLSQLTTNLSNSNKYLEEIYSSMRSMLLISNEIGIIKSVNNTTKSLLGFEENEMVGQPIQQFLAKEHNDVALMSGQIATGEEITFVRKDNSHFVALSASSLITSIDGTTKDIIFIAQDLTKYKVLEEKVNAAKEAVAVSRHAGMSEIATSVLHNVGNVLNSVNVSTVAIKTMLLNSQLNHLKKVTALLKEHTGDLGTFITTDPKGKLIPHYLQELTNQWEVELHAYLEECESLIKFVQHIKEIVNMQQSFSGSYGVIESVQLSELIEDAINMTLIDFDAERIKVVKDYHDVGLVYIDKVKLLQILINLVKNAKQSLSVSSAIDKQITCRIEQAKNDVVVIQVTDNGVGIAPENLTKIFGFGFTTKKSGHGFGLHSCIFIAKELHGSLEVSSEGLNKGATFTLTLPRGAPPKKIPASTKV